MLLIPAFACRKYKDENIDNVFFFFRQKATFIFILFNLSPLFQNGSPLSQKHTSTTIPRCQVVFVSIYIIPIAVTNAAYLLMYGIVGFTY